MEDTDDAKFEDIDGTCDSDSAIHVLELLSLPKALSVVVNDGSGLQCNTSNSNKCYSRSSAQVAIS